jgi:uncharacterized membrane protein YqjE
MNPEPQPQTEEGLIASLHRFGRSLLGLVITRLEILSTEVDETRLDLTKLAIVALVVLFSVQMGLILAMLFVVLAVGNEHRLTALGISALVFLLGAGGGVLWLKGWLKDRPRLFRTTIAERRKDASRLRGNS